MKAFRRQSAARATWPTPAWKRPATAESNGDQRLGFEEGRVFACLWEDLGGSRLVIAFHVFPQAEAVRSAEHTAEVFASPQVELADDTWQAPAEFPFQRAKILRGAGHYVVTLNAAKLGQFGGPAMKSQEANVPRLTGVKLFMALVFVVFTLWLCMSVIRTNETIPPSLGPGFNHHP